MTTVGEIKQLLEDYQDEINDDTPVMLFQFGYRSSSWQSTDDAAVVNDDREGDERPEVTETSPLGYVLAIGIGSEGSHRYPPSAIREEFGD